MIMDELKTMSAVLKYTNRRYFNPNDIVRHFKGAFYQIIEIGEHTETGELMAVYRRLNDDTIWIRPYDNFCGFVDKEKYPDARQEYRFVKVVKEIK